MAPTLGYWKLRGLAQYIRFLLEYTGTEYNERLYTFGSAPDFDRSEWMKEKFNLGLDFPNLPYYIDGDVKLTQSTAILRYIGEKNNLAGKTPEEKRTLHMLECEAYDMRAGFGRLCYDPKFEELKNQYISETVPAKFEQVSKFLGDRQWFVGDNVTYIDFFFYEVLYDIRDLCPTSLDKFKNLKEFMTRVESLEPIKKYINSSKYIKGPLNGPLARYGGS